MGHECLGKLQGCDRIHFHAHVRDFEVNAIDAFERRHVFRGQARIAYQDIYRLVFIDIGQPIDPRVVSDIQLLYDDSAVFGSQRLQCFRFLRVPRRGDDILAHRCVLSDEFQSDPAIRAGDQHCRFAGCKFRIYPGR